MTALLLVADSLFGYPLLPYDSARRYLGRYPNPQKAMKPEFYFPPPGFVKVTQDMETLRISPRITWGDVVCPWPKTWPRWAYVKPEFVEFLEELMDSVAPFRFISFFRSPRYNRRKRRSRYSRHLFGDAADVIVDLDRDWEMDDLNGDGAVDVEDALVIADAVERLKAKFGKVFGMGVYPKPFIHLDMRGFEAWWGDRWWRVSLSPEAESLRLVKDSTFAPVRLRITARKPKSKPPPFRLWQRPERGLLKIFYKKRVVAAESTRLWVRPGPGNPQVEAWAASDSGLTFLLRNKLYFYDKKGLRWFLKFPHQPGPQRASLALSGSVALLSKWGKLFCVDFQKFELRWVREGEGQVWASDSLAYLLRGDTLWAFSLADGSARRRWVNPYKGHQVSLGPGWLEFRPLDPKNSHRFWAKLP